MGRAVEESSTFGSGRRLPFCQTRQSHSFLTRRPHCPQPQGGGGALCVSLLGSTGRPEAPVPAWERRLASTLPAPPPGWRPRRAGGPLTLTLTLTPTRGWEETESRWESLDKQLQRDWKGEAEAPGTLGGMKWLKGRMSAGRLMRLYLGNRASQQEEGPTVGLVAVIS